MKIFKHNNERSDLWTFWLLKFGSLIRRHLKRFL